MSHVVIFELADQTLRHAAPELIASASYEITDMSISDLTDPARVLATGAAVVPAWTLTLDDEAGASLADDTLIPVAATAGPSIGDDLVIIASDGSFEPLELEGVELDVYLRAGSTLAGEYAVGATVRGVTITAPVPIALYNFEDALDDQRSLRVLWTYTTAAGERRVSEQLELSRGTEATASTGPAVRLLLTGYPTIKGQLLEGLTVTGLARFSLSEVITELSSRGLDHKRIMAGDIGTGLLMSKMLEEAAIRGYSPGAADHSTFRAERHTDYTRRLDALTQGRPGTQVTPFDTDEVANARADQNNRSLIQIGL